MRPRLQPFRMPVQMVSRPHANFRGYCGMIASGRLRKGDEITVAPSLRSSRVERILLGGDELDEALHGRCRHLDAQR